jgi:hypothetical protein
MKIIFRKYFISKQVGRIKPLVSVTNHTSKGRLHDVIVPGSHEAQGQFLFKYALPPSGFVVGFAAHDNPYYESNRDKTGRPTTHCFAM